MQELSQNIDKEEDTDGINDINSPAPKGIPISKLIEYRNKDLSYQDIADLVGCSKPNVYARLKQYDGEIKSLKSYKENRADVLAVVGSKMLNSLTSNDIEKASAYQRVGMFALLYDKERLERGQSTSNIAYANMTESDIDAKIKELEAKLSKIDNI